MKKIIIPAMLLIIGLVSLLSCAPAVSPEEYDRVSDELTAAQSQIRSLQGELAEAEDLKAKYDELTASYDVIKGQLEVMPVKYDELSKQYDELSELYDAVIEGTAGITEADVEQAIFELINRERQNNGLNELEWSKGLYSWAVSHSRYMARENRFEYSDYTTWQAIFWAAGYSTVDRIAKAALLTWQESRQYQVSFLNGAATYGAVAVAKSGEIFYITYFAHFSS